MNDSIIQSLPAMLRRVLSKAGQFTGFLWVRPLKTRKGVTATVTKTVRCVGRLGVEHDARAKVIEARESGLLPATNQGLPWGEWLIAPYLITHKGNVYVRIYPVEGRAPRVMYKIDGKVVSKAEAEALCLASEFGKVDGAIGCMTLSASALRVVR